MSDTGQDDVSDTGELGLEGFQHPPEEGGLSLEDLSDAFAKAINSGENPYERRAEQRVPPAEDEEASSPAEEDLDDEAADCDVSPENILEAMLFVGAPNNEPLTSKQVSSLMRGVRPQEIDHLVGELNAIYDEEECPYRIESVGAGYKLVLREQHAHLRDRFYGRIKEAKLSQAAVDILAIVAYRQPVTRAEIDQVRGKPAGATLTQLVRRQLLRIERTEEKPRVTRYFTTDRFLDLFGLQDLGELPQSEDLDRPF